MMAKFPNCYFSKYFEKFVYEFRKEYLVFRKFPYSYMFQDDIQALLFIILLMILVAIDYITFFKRPYEQ